MSFRHYRELNFCGDQPMSIQADPVSVPYDVDLTMIDASQDPWFDLDLVNYQAQLVNGYTRMTARAGLEIFMPDLDEKTPKNASQSITLEWLKNRNRSLPLDVPVK
jgi:hypothetical protein